ncbi:MAG: hypothetical protein CM1200mP30_17250 [Pseudomonadota bacterium]|nr:MAG: hypothetical protein CM1200mP30_17250 [Pseudomonadota bacterium]
MDGLTDHAPLLEGEDKYNEYMPESKPWNLSIVSSLTKISSVSWKPSFRSRIPFSPRQSDALPFPTKWRKTHPHQDWILSVAQRDNQLLGALGDIPLEVGGLQVLGKEHKQVSLNRELPLDLAKKQSNRSKPRMGQSGYQAGDLLMFKMLTIHGAAPNLTSDMMRLSTEFRYTGESPMIAEDLGLALTWT